MDCIFFGLQIVANRENDLRRAELLREVLRTGNASHAGIRHRSMHVEIADIMRTLLDRAKSGYWDFIGDPAKARAEFDDWCEDIKMASDLSKQEAVSPFRGSAQGEYNVITVAYLLLKGSPSAAEAGLACDFQPGDFWYRSTFRRILECVRALDFSDVQQSAAFIMPGAPEHGISERALHDKTFEYLRDLE